MSVEVDVLPITASQAEFSVDGVETDLQEAVLGGSGSSGSRRSPCAVGAAAALRTSVWP